MQSITLQSHVGKDGILRLQVPVGVEDADLRVTINFQLPDLNGAAKSPEELGWPPEFFEETFGCLKDNPIERWPQGYMEKAIGSWQGEFPVLEDEGKYEVREELP